mmetsp:Transcript_16660/g.47808  ORF Transcript_16660/g.47808 Transcript_16660/m.47808 type:complete len:1149 (-) Transcript_16660:246-3692(-)
MDPERVRAYLQVACAGLGFDIGEVWYTSNENGSSTVAQIEAEESTSDGEGNSGASAASSVNAVKPPKPKKKIKFLQLYTSNSFDDRRSELVLPPSERRRIEAERAAFATKAKAKASDGSSGGGRNGAFGGGLNGSSIDMDGFKPLARGNSILSPAELEKHVLSPRLVDAISDSAEVVWANCSESGGLIGRSDMKLQTAVGMPVAMDDDGNMCIVVMFSPNNVQSSDDAVEYLQAIGKSAVSSSIPCLLPVMEEGNRLMGPVAPANASPAAVAKAPSSGATEAHPDKSAANLSDRYSNGDGGSGNDVQVEGKQHKSETQDFGHGVKARFVSLDEAGEDDAEVHNLVDAPRDQYGIPMLPSFAELGSSPNSSIYGARTGIDGGNDAASSGGGGGGVRPLSPVAEDAFDEASYGVWSTVMGSPPTASSTAAKAAGRYGGVAAMAGTGFMGLSPSKVGAGDTTRATQGTNSSSSTLEMGTPMLQERRKYRLEAFLSAFLGMSVFDAADVWIPGGGGVGGSLVHVTSVSTTDTNEGLNYFKRVSESSTIKIWSGAVGRAFGSANPVWTTNKGVFIDTDRASAFEYAKILTALAVPIHSAGTVTPSCVICCYSLVRSVSVPFVLKFVQQALRLLWDGLDRVDPHESVGRRLWSDVAPADLGEMAADVEMQKAFLSKKRPRDSISSSSDPPQQNSSGIVYTGTDAAGHGRKSSLALQLEALQVPGDVEGKETFAAKSPSSNPSVLGLAPAPVLPDHFMPSTNDVHAPALDQQRVLAMKTQVQEAVRSIDNAVLWSSHKAVATNQEGTKRAHISNSLTTMSPPPHLDYPHPAYSDNYFPPPPNTITAAATACGETMDQPPREDPQVAMENIRAFNAMAQQAAVAEARQGGSEQQMTMPSWSDTYLPGAAEVIPAAAPDEIYSFSEPADQAQAQYCLPMNDSVTPAVTMESPLVASTAPTAPMSEAAGSNGGKPCRIQGCNAFAVARRPYCVKHSGNRLCEREGCSKCAQGATRFCIAHGGGRRCTFPGCDKGARDKFFCAAHGGGKRCTHPGCSKSAVGGSNLCTSHGGGRRCAVQGCDKSAQSSTKFCVKHGGGKKCAHASCTKVARGRTLYCAAHGGGVRCKLEGCNRVAIGKLQLCRAHGGGSNAGRRGKSKK